jgi:GNAT superfamily N-acetyltransferase
MKEIAKRLLRMLLGDYSAYYIYSLSADEPSTPEATSTDALRMRPIDEPVIACCAEPLIREQASYAGAGSRAYACFNGDRIVSVCFYWFGDRYLKRNFWPLAEHEAKLVQIVTLPDMRGRGIASLLIAFSSSEMRKDGFCRLYARIWHSNKPSMIAFERACWHRIATVIEVNPCRLSRPFRIRFGARPHASSRVGL